MNKTFKKVVLGASSAAIAGCLVFTGISMSANSNSVESVTIKPASTVSADGNTTFEKVESSTPKHDTTVPEKVISDEAPVSETPAVEDAPDAESPADETPVTVEPDAPAEDKTVTPAPETDAIVPDEVTPSEEAPVTEDPTAETPVVEEPAEETPVVVEPEAPVEETPVVTPPVVEAPTPVVEEPVVEAPAPVFAWVDASPAVIAAYNGDFSQIVAKQYEVRSSSISYANNGDGRTQITWSSDDLHAVALVPEADATAYVGFVNKVLAAQALPKEAPAPVFAWVDASPAVKAAYEGDFSQIVAKQYDTRGSSISVADNGDGRKSVTWASDDLNATALVPNADVSSFTEFLNKVLAAQAI